MYTALIGIYGLVLGSNQLEGRDAIPGVSTHANVTEYSGVTNAQIQNGVMGLLGYSYLTRANTIPGASPIGP